MFRKVLSTAVWTYDVHPVDNVDNDTTAIPLRYYTPLKGLMTYILAALSLLILGRTS